MQRYTKLAGVLALGAGLSGCGDFLTGPGLTDNPNQPLAVTYDQLFIGMQARQFTLQEGQVARQTAIYTQQLTGIFNQQLEWGTKYLITENDIQAQYNGFFIGGGLRDLRKLQEDAKTAGDTRIAAIAKVWEAFSMGTATSVWGDLPYREAAQPETFPIPKLDPQQQIYADIQALLSTAITELGASPATPFATRDLVYGGNVARWQRAAYTLKARYHLHTAPRLGQAAYQAALAAALQGINEAPATVADAVHGQAPGDFRAFHGNTLDDANLWAQFLTARADIAAGSRMVEVLKARGNDPRLAGYFDPATDAQYRGANQWGGGPAPWSLVDGPVRMVRTFRQPFVTWTENQLIIAEAQFQLGNEPAARGALNAVRASLGMPALPGPITLEQIMVEKWIAQFQNIDAYSDYRRTCYPRLVPGGPNANVPAGQIPGRLPYAGSERLQNPNIPAPSEQPVRNWNHENVICPSGGGTL
jgi:hypothetical protein